MSKNIRNIELYIHIPYCKRKCKYCDFLSSPEHMDDIDSYITKLISEIEYNGRKIKANPLYSYKVTSIFIGGGTPSVLSIKHIKSIMDAIRASYKLTDECEITMEMNPESLTLLKAKGYFQAGINRASLGLQSAQNEELEKLGRLHDYDIFKDALFFIRVAGFKNINVDLMYGIPGQTLDTWEDTLNKVAVEPITHISAYSLIIEEGTAFATAGEELIKELPDEDTIVEMGKNAADILSKYGYSQYEVSNYAKENRECRHNMGYWSMTEYLGMGLGAASYYNGERFKNTSDYSTYMTCARFADAVEIERSASINKDMEEFMFLGLRKIKGISLEEFKERYNSDIYDIYGNVLDKYIARGYLKDNDGMICFTKKGMNVSNTILAEFLIEEE